MKILLQILLLAGLAWNAPATGEFSDWHGNIPKGWEVNAVYQGATRERQMRDGIAALCIQTTRQPFAMMAPFATVTPGEQIRITVRYRGRGRFSAGLYCYNAAHTWVGKNLDAQSKMLDAADWTLFETVWTIPDTEFPNRGKITQIRPMLTIAPESSFEIAAYTMERLQPTPDTPATPSGPSVPADLPAKSEIQAGTPLYATVGSECNLYFANLDWPEAVRYQIDASCGRQEDDRWTDVPQRSGQFPLLVRALDAAGKNIREEHFSLIVAPTKVKKRALSVLFVGDSLTDASIYPAQVMARLAAAGLDAHSIGSHTGGGKAPDGKSTAHEGRGGWTFANYLTRWTEGTDYRSRSPFLAAPGKLDLAGYFAKYNQGNPPDVVVLFLGCNDIAALTAANRATGVARTIGHAEKLVRAFCDAAPQARIGLALLPPPAPKQEAFGRNYGTGIQRDTYLANRRALLAGLQRQFGASREVTLLPTHLALDCVNHYPQKNEPAAAGSSVQVRRYVNAVHPTADGYRQLGDAIANWIITSVHTK